MHLSEDPTNALIGADSGKNDSGIGLYRIKTTNGKQLEVIPLIESITVTKIHKIEDKLLLVDDTGQFFMTQQSYNEILEATGVQSIESVKKIDLPYIFNPEKIKFFKHQSSHLVVYQSSEKEITVAQLYPDVKIVTSISKIFSGRIADFNIVDSEIESFSLYMVSITGKFSLYRIPMDSKTFPSGAVLVQKQVLTIKTDSIIHYSLVYSRNKNSKYLVVFTMNILEDSHMHVFSMDSTEKGYKIEQIDKIRKICFSKNLAKVDLQGDELSYYLWNSNLSTKYSVGMYRFRFNLMEFKLASEFLGEHPHGENEVKSVDFEDGLLVSLDVNGNVGTID